MSLLSDFEDRVARAVEGVFAGAFKSPVQPAEVAKALGKAMDDGRVVGVGKVYVPVRYGVALSADDSNKLGAFAETLAGELATFLIGHAQSRGYHLPDKPSVRFTVHEDLRLGRFRVSSEMTAAPAQEGAPAASEEPAPSQAEFATVSVGDSGHDVVLRGERHTVGRLASCDISIADANASREHAAFIAEGAGWAIEDLGSTNGTFLNGKPVGHARLRDGDVVQIGVTRLVFHETSS